MSLKKKEISFQVVDDLKQIYDIVGETGALKGTRLCAAGFLLVLENPAVRHHALRRLGEFERGEQSPSGEDDVRAYVESASHPEEVPAGAKWAAVIDRAQLELRKPNGQAKQRRKK